MKIRGAFIGLSTLDVVYYTKHFPEEDTKLYCTDQQVIPGGMATNAAITFSGLQGQSSLLTCVGEQDQFGDTIREEIKKRQIKLLDFADKEFNHIPISSILINQTTGSRTILNKPFIPYAPVLIPPLDLSEVDILLVDGFYIDLAIAAAKEAKRLSIPVVMDAGSWKPGFERLLPLVDIMIVSAGFRPPGQVSFTETLEYLLKFPFCGMAFTNGAESVVAYSGQIRHELQPKQISPVDTLGAGDVLHGAFCYYFGSSGEFIPSLEKAMKIASKSCEFIGPHTWMETD